MQGAGWSEIEVRRLGYGDLPAVLAIERRSFPTPWSLAMFVLELSKPSGIALAASAEGRLIGYLICSRYADVWHLMNVAIKNHDNASLNPNAQFGITIQKWMEGRIATALKKGKPAPAWSTIWDFLHDEAGNPTVAWPLRLFDCCLETDGACAVIVTSAERARDLAPRPAYIRAMAQGTGGRELFPITAFNRERITGMEETARMGDFLFAMADLRREDIDVAELYDHFGRFDQSVKAFEKSQIYYNLANDYSGLAKLQRKSGMIFESRRAIGFMKNALLTFEKYSMKIEKARCLNNIGAECFYVADFANAEEHLLKSLEVFRVLESPEIDIPLNNLALVFQQKKDYPKTLQLLDDARNNVSEPFNEIFISMNMANVYRKIGIPERSKQIIVHLEPLVTSYHEPVMNDYYGFNRSMVHLDLNEIDEAEKWLARFEPNDYKRDGELVIAKRYRALSEIMEKRSSVNNDDIGELRCKSLELFRTARPQKWFYELDYYPCDIHLWD